jgi:hypothetical protein
MRFTKETLIKHIRAKKLVFTLLKESFFSDENPRMGLLQNKLKGIEKLRNGEMEKLRNGFDIAQIKKLCNAVDVVDDNKNQARGDSIDRFNDLHNDVKTATMKLINLHEDIDVQKILNIYIGDKARMRYIGSYIDGIKKEVYYVGQLPSNNNQCLETVFELICDLSASSPSFPVLIASVSDASNGHRFVQVKTDIRNYYAPDADYRHHDFFERFNNVSSELSGQSGQWGEKATFSDDLQVQLNKILLGDRTQIDWSGGGKKQEVRSKEQSKYLKTKRTHNDKKGVTRVVHTKAGRDYVKRKYNGHMVYVLVK